jgi:hypothetical protein
MSTTLQARFQRISMRSRIATGLHWLSVVVVIILGNVAIAFGRPGDVATKWQVNDDNPSASVPTVEERNKDPLEFAYFLQDLLARAQMAYDIENWPDVVKYNEALATAVPDVARPFSTLCVAYAKLGKLDVAAAYCGKAVTLQGSRVYDHLRFLDLTLRKKKLTQEDLDALEASLNHLRGHAAQHPQAPPGERAMGQAPPSPERRPETGDELMQQLRNKIRQEQSTRPAEPGTATPETEPVEEETDRTSGIHLPTEIELRACKLAALIADDKKLAACVQALRSYKTDPRLLLPFSWTRALLHKDHTQAEALLQEARSLGLPKETLLAMENDQNHAFGRFGRRGLWMLGFAAGAAVIAGAVALRKKRLGSRATGSSEPMPKEPISSGAGSSATLPPEATSQG